MEEEILKKKKWFRLRIKDNKHYCHIVKKL